MKTIEVLHIITTIERGGAEKAVLVLAGIQAQSGYDVTVLPLKGDPELSEDFASAGVKVNISLLNKPLFRQLIGLRRLRKSGLVVHAHLPRSELFARLALGAGCAINTRHNSEQFLPKTYSALSSLVSRWVTKSAKVIAISESVRTFLLESREVRNAAQICVIYYGFQSKHLDSLGNSPKVFEGLGTRPINLGTISRLVPQKNIVLLIMLAKSLIESKVNFTLSIVGKGPEESVLKALVERLELKDKVYFVGRLRDVSDFLDNLDVFLLTSNYEGFGLVLLEAIDHHLPIIASNISSIPEVLGDQHPGLFETGNLDSLQDKLQNLISSPSKRLHYLEMQNKRLKLFSIDKYFASHDSIYREFMENNK